MEVSVKGSVEEIMRSLNAHPKAVEKATVLALNKVGATVRARVIRELRDRFGLQRASVANRLKMRKAHGDSLRVDVVAHPSAPSIAAYSGRQTRDGVLSRAWRRARVYPRTFIPKGRSVALRRVGKARLPVEKVYGPSLPKSFAKDEITQHMNRTVNERFPLEFIRALRAIWAREGV